MPVTEEHHAGAERSQHIERPQTGRRIRSWTRFSHSPDVANTERQEQAISKNCYIFRTPLLTSRQGSREAAKAAKKNTRVAFATFAPSRARIFSARRNMDAAKAWLELICPRPRSARLPFPPRDGNAF